MDKITNPSFGKRLRELRNSTGQTQKQLSEKLGVADRTIRHLEHGDYVPTAEMQADLAGIFGISVDELMSSEVLILSGGAEVVRRLRPYVLLHLTESGRQMRKAGDEILELERQPVIDGASKYRMSVLKEQLRGQSRYFGQILRDLSIAESQK